MQGDEDDLAAIAGSEHAGTSHVPHAVELTSFVEAALRGDDAQLEGARSTLLAAVGPAAFVDAAAIVGNFERMTRIADSTGIPLDAQVNTISADIQERLGLRRFASAASTRESGPVWRWISARTAPFAFRTMRWIGALGRRLSRPASSATGPGGQSDA